MTKTATLLFMLCISCCAVAVASDVHELERQLKSDYEGKTLTLRHFYQSDRLRFHSDGSLVGDATVGPWTVDGQLSVQEVRLREDRIEIRGRRVYVVFNSKGKPIDYLTTLDEGTHDKALKDIAKMLRELSVQIEVELPSGSVDQPAIDSAMRSVFLTSGDSPADMMPAYWRNYFAGLEDRHLEESSMSEPVYHVSSGKGDHGVSPPRARYSPNPDYPDAARKAKYQGVVVLSLVVNQKGDVQNLRIERPLGIGLDEKAVDAVSSWKFDPAKRDRQPVAVSIHVEVQFRLY